MQIDHRLTRHDNRSQPKGGGSGNSIMAELQRSLPKSKNALGQCFLIIAGENKDNVQFVDQATIDLYFPVRIGGWKVGTFVVVIPHMCLIGGHRGMIHNTLKDEQWKGSVFFCSIVV